MSDGSSVEGPSQQLRQFSKDHSKEERSETARAIREKRTNYFSNKTNLLQKKEDLSQKEAELGVDVPKKEKELREIQRTIEGLSVDWFSKNFNFLRIRGLKAKAGEAKSSLDQVYDLQNERQIIDGDLRNRRQLEEAKKLLRQFYTREKEKWNKAPFSKEEINKYFSEEYLSSISDDDYFELLKRYPQQLVSHVVRQGVRDHLGHMYHIAGKGEFHNGFTEILKDGKLRSPLGVYAKEGVQKQAVADYLDLKSLGLTKDRALENIKLRMERYADKTSVHFAIDEVADQFYGGESGNEIFFVFPSAFIASNYYYSGTANPDFLSGAGGWNDQWVFPKSEEDGININAGLVFLPVEAQVDPKTGSKYELDADNKPFIEGESYKLANNTISSKEYWEKYFEDHPDQRPKRIMWYGGNPTDVIRRFNYGMPSKRHYYKEFPENVGYPPGVDEAAERFYELARDVVEDFYSDRSDVSEGV